MRKIDFTKPEFYLNRDLGYLHFNHRVLELAEDQDIPLLERLNYIFICSANLDEFFEIKVANLKQRLQMGQPIHYIEHLPLPELLDKIFEYARELSIKQQRLLKDELIPKLEKENIFFLEEKNWHSTQRLWCHEYFKQQVMPLLSPMAIDPAHPFPRLINKGLNFIIQLKGKDAFGRKGDKAIIHVPRGLPRLIRLPKELTKEGYHFVYLSEIIQAFNRELFPGMQILGSYAFRLTRNSDLAFVEENTEDLARVLSTGLVSRHYGMVVRLELSQHCPEEIANFLLERHKLSPQEMYRTEVPLNLARYRGLISEIDRPDLKYPELKAQVPHRLRHGKDYFSTIREKDVLLYHPFESFNVILDLVRQAALDPNVLAIKITLYRTGPDSLIVRALVDAARAGKEVTAVVELRARFDEAANIQLASRLHEAGALVVYGVTGYKTHAKMMLIVRREGAHLKRYAHLSTGNYHAGTARLYTDFGLLTYNKTLCHDVDQLFLLLTGIAKQPKFSQLAVAPFELFDKLKHWIEREIAHAKKGKPAHIIAKMNALTDPKIIELLYRASRAQVKIELIVRGTCCLRPQMPGISENITVRTVLGRFLEHSRVFWFYNNGHEELYLSSADWMERNLFHRVEVCFPILDAHLRERIKEEGLMIYLKDNTYSWMLDETGNYRRIKRKARRRINAHDQLMQPSTYEHQTPPNNERAHP